MQTFVFIAANFCFPPFVTIAARCPGRPFAAHGDHAQPKDSLTPEEAALRYALAKNRNPVDLIGKQALPVIAVRIVQTVRRNSKVDWWRREGVRIRMPFAVMKIRRRHGFPQDFAADAVKVVTRRAEVLSRDMSKAA